MSVTGRRRLAVALVILVVASGARLWALHDAPPGLQHDEIFKAEDAQRLVEQHDLRIFYPSNQGHEGAYVWLLGAAYMLFGSTLIMIKFPAFVCGMLTVALLFRFATQAFGALVGVLAAGLAAVSFWAVFTSRVGLRAVMLPVVTLLVLWGVWRLCNNRPDQETRRWRLAALTGLALGFAVYTYTSSFALYAAFGVFVLALAVLDGATLRRRGAELALVAVVGVLVALPMVYVRLTDPHGTFRADTILRPWNDFRQGKPDELINNAWKLAGMAAFTGDPEWRYNVAGRPLFVLPVGLLVYAGLGVALWHARRRPINVFLIALALLGLIPSLLTVAAPSFLRSVITLPSIMIFVALAVQQIGRWLGRGDRSRWAWGIGLVVIAVTAGADWHAYFDVWPRQDAVYTIYRDDLEQLAAYLRERDDSLVFVTTPEENLDPFIYKYTNAPLFEDTHVVFFDAFANIVLNDQPTLLFVSPRSPISEKHADWLTTANGTAYLGQLTQQNGATAYDIYRLSDHGHTLAERLAEVGRWPVFAGPAGGFSSLEVAEWGEPMAYPVRFGDVVQLVGVEVPRLQVFAEHDGVNLQLYFQPLLVGQNVPLNVFVHLSGLDQHIVAQRDLLGVPTVYWQRGITFVQDNFVPFWDPVPPGRYLLTMGVYNWATGERLPVLDAQGHPVTDYLGLGVIEVVPRE